MQTYTSSRYQSIRSSESPQPYSEELHAEAVDIALDRVNNLAWVGLTHRFEESTCMLAYVLRKAPKDIKDTNYDRGGLISEAFRGNHPHSGSAWEGAMSKELRKTLYEVGTVQVDILDILITLSLQPSGFTP
jgi:hypothetical protein